MVQLFYKILPFLFLTFACKNEPKSASEAYPKTPEAVVRQWQIYMDKNNISAAKLLSTSKTRQWLEGIEKAVQGDTLHMNTEFVSIKCEEQVNQAICKCISKQNSSTETYEDIFLLLKEEGKWLIDLDSEHSFDDEFLPIFNKDSLQ